MKLLLENWRRYLNEEKQLSLPLSYKKGKSLYDNFYITYRLDSNSGDSSSKWGEVCGSGDKIGYERQWVGRVDLYAHNGEEVMSFWIHKYKGWLGDLLSLERDCGHGKAPVFGPGRLEDIEGKCVRDDCVEDFKANDLITDEFADEDLYSGHWMADEDDLEFMNISRVEAAKLGIALRESVLALLKAELGAKYYVMTDATHYGGSNEAAQKIVKRLVKSGALGPPHDLSPDDVGEHYKKMYLVFPISNPVSRFKIK